jgi:CheY-like chemotaxis protein
MSTDAMPLQILLVEDDPELNEIATEMLEVLGAKVTPAASPEEALQCLAREAEFHLLFTDYRFASAMNGVELAQRAVALRPTLRVIIASGFEPEAIALQADAGYLHIQKPYWLEDLRKHLAHLFPNHSNRALSCS